MEELYHQNFGKNRVVSIKGWNRRDALIEDLKSSTMYAMEWDLFFRYHTKIDPYECNINDYVGANLDVRRLD